MATVPALIIRAAREPDLPRIVELIHLGTATVSDEELGPPLPAVYLTAFQRIADQPGWAQMVAELHGEVVGTFLYSTLPNLAHQGRPVGQVESVHVAEAHRGHGIGEQMMAWAIARARSDSCVRLQLTSNRVRTDAHRFYRRLGFVDSHVGMKLALDQ